MDEPFFDPRHDEGERRIVLLNKVIYYMNGIFIFFMFWFSVASMAYLKPVLKDSQELIKDASETIFDFGELIPEVNESLAILKSLCNSEHSPIHQWCKDTSQSLFISSCNNTEAFLLTL